MYPVEDRTRRTRVDTLIELFEDSIQGYYDFLTSHDDHSVEQGKRSFCRSLRRLAPLLDQEQGPFCLGDTFSIAECYAAPWIHRFHVTPNYFRGVTIQQLLQSDHDGNADEAISTWMDAVLQRPSVQLTNGPEDYVLKSTNNYFVTYVSPNSPAAAAAQE